MILGEEMNELDKEAFKSRNLGKLWEGRIM